MRISPTEAQVPGCQEDLMDHARETIIISAPGRQRRGQEVNIRPKLIVVAMQEQGNG